MVVPLNVRQWQGMTLPAAGQFELDPQHTTAGFVARHLMVTQVRGRFEEIDATIHIAEDPVESMAHAVIKTASITTGTEDRDVHLKSPDFLDVDRFPTMTFVSREVSAGGGPGPKWTMVDGTMRRRRRDAFGVTVIGDLTIRGVTRPVELDVRIDGIKHDPWGGERLALSASGEIDREAYGMEWNVALEAGGWLVSKTVQLEIRAQAIRLDSAAGQA